MSVSQSLVVPRRKANEARVLPKATQWWFSAEYKL
jgi:hypothetical protein